MSDENKHSLEPNNWVKEYSDYLYNYTITRIDNHEQAKDIVQETFFSALKAAKNYRGQASERTWLIAILKRKIIDHYRKINSRKGKAEIKVNFHEDGDKKGSWLEERVPQLWDNEAEKQIENTELKSVLDNCINNLPDKYRLVFNLKNVEHYETEEICNELDITASNLWVIIHRARHQLRKCMEDNWFAK
ncbi:sigma-70 family RNA polymerase sigma factor [Aureibaculum algae]|uniref:Sigma-70 family RNA polymerase sigma factor n=2 Tax=Aureibaculum TaxID=2706948 RepID=A0A5B7TWJ7_9FLAO|nr:MULTISPECIES: sigma-70 family RNA polymerase sigma factor [Aureibaculum]MBJ2173894.1 sigma-70 family RNA polymerase sigma factor [Aureibaculum flavum]QCX40720.1 sigma-70 family RNA polymerase sigma factor [Aureibaculum algae]